MKQIFLDHNSTTEMEQGALEALLFFSSNAYGNASSIHWAGQKTKSIVENAREELAGAFGADESEPFLFTSGATEAINTVLKGAYFAQTQDGRQVHLVTSAVEHEATLESARFLEQRGAKLHLSPVDSQGCLDLSALRELLSRLASDRKNFIMASFMAVNNETGVVFPYGEIAELCKEFGAWLHVDAVQAPGKLAGFALRNFNPDFASFSAHKIGGPKGVGALYVKRGRKLEPFFHGGAQERKRRAGTVNVPGIGSFGVAAKALAKRDLGAITKLRDELETIVRAQITGVQIQGAGSPRVGNTTNLLFDGVRGEALVMGLDLAGFAVSSGSACNSGSILPSHVLLAMGLDKAAAASAVRVSLGTSNTKSDLQAFAEALQRVVARVRTQAARSS